MPVFLARVVYNEWSEIWQSIETVQYLNPLTSGEQSDQACDVHFEHGRTENVARGIWSDPDAIDCMRSVEIDSLDHRQC